MKTPGITTAFGEDISEIIGVGHKSYNGYADWFFICIIRGAEREVSPIHIRYDPKDQAVSAVFNKASTFLSDYLSANGRWLNPPVRARDGASIHWQAIKPEGRSKRL